MDRADAIHAEAQSTAAIVVDAWAARNRHRLPGGLAVEARRDLEFEIGHVLRPLIARTVAAQAITPIEAEKLVPFRGNIEQPGATPIKHPPSRRGKRKAVNGDPK
jgi:hypothetical protein